MKHELGGNCMYVIYLKDEIHKMHEYWALYCIVLGCSMHCIVGLSNTPTTMQCAKGIFEKSPTTLFRSATLLARFRLARCGSNYYHYSNNILINTNNYIFTMHHVVKNEDCSNPIDSSVLFMLSELKLKTRYMM